MDEDNEVTPYDDVATEDDDQNSEDDETEADDDSGVGSSEIVIAWERAHLEVANHKPNFVRQTKDQKIIIITDNANAFRRSITRLGPK